MSERKVLNKYFPPDFDPAKIPRRKMANDAQYKVRLMAPFSMRCDTCGDYIYKGKKFNARKEKVEGELYLGILIFRFYIRCPKCSAEITFKTDPKNTDYVCEHGAQRNFEPWREETDVKELQRLEKEKAEENNPMKALENRTVASKVEMDILDALDEIRTRNAASERMDAANVLERLQKGQREKVEAILRRQEEEDAGLARSIFKSADDGVFVRRLLEAEDLSMVSFSGAEKISTAFVLPDDSLSGKTSANNGFSISDWAVAPVSKAKRGANHLLVVAADTNKKAKTTLTRPKAQVDPTDGKGKTTGIAGLAAYASDDDSGSE